MSWYILEPRDPLLVRDGRPFTPGTDGARSMDTVPPSVTAGALRTRVWHTKGGWAVDEAKALPVSGPLLAELDLHDDTLKHLWLAAPRDCVLFEPEPVGEGPHKVLRRCGLQVGDAFATGGSSLPTGLLPVVPVGALPMAKPAKSAPAYWSHTVLQRWLAGPPPAEDTLSRKPDDTRAGLPHEPRVHVGLKLDGSRTAEDGRLFQSDGLRFADREHDPSQEDRRMGDLHRLALLVHCRHEQLTGGAVTLGGERRLSRFAPLNGQPPIWTAPALSTSRARIVLLTPALFDEGSVPKAIAGAPVIAAAVGRPQTISGWDIAAGGPKPTRRMAPAGSVYWVDLRGLDAKAWSEKVHFGSVCSNQQDNRDGFGLAVVGVSA
jgi:CRISPR-associated protein Cmr3